MESGLHSTLLFSVQTHYVIICLNIKNSFLTCEYCKTMQGPYLGSACRRQSSLARAQDWGGPKAAVLLWLCWSMTAPSTPSHENAGKEALTIFVTAGGRALFGVSRPARSNPEHSLLFLPGGPAAGDWRSRHPEPPLASPQPLTSAAPACWAASGAGYQRALLRCEEILEKQRPFLCCGLACLGLFHFLPPSFSVSEINYPECVFISCTRL